MKIAMEFEKQLAPHRIKQGDRVYQRVNPWHTGTVVRREAGYGLTVKYDTGGKFSYPESRAWDFLVGRPSSETLAKSQAPQS